ncbi:hypothetical protein HDV00_011087 [Rhizophlyctis rosea]|nr:hypothetical protein HDV00_011087 [Rhizophlyctis rosea]
MARLKDGDRRNSSNNSETQLPVDSPSSQYQDVPSPPPINHPPSESLSEWKKARRAEQNRTSQRAFRIRRDAHMHDLQLQFQRANNPSKALAEAESRCAELQRLLQDQRKQWERQRAGLCKERDEAMDVAKQSLKQLLECQEENNRLWDAFCLAGNSGSNSVLSLIARAREGKTTSEQISQSTPFERKRPSTSLASPPSHPAKKTRLTLNGDNHATMPVEQEVDEWGFGKSWEINQTTVQTTVHYSGMTTQPVSRPSLETPLNGNTCLRAAFRGYQDGNETMKTGNQSESGHSGATNGKKLRSGDCMGQLGFVEGKTMAMHPQPHPLPTDTSKSSPATPPTTGQSVWPTAIEGTTSFFDFVSRFRTTSATSPPSPPYYRNSATPHSPDEPAVPSSPTQQAQARKTAAKGKAKAVATSPSSDGDDFQKPMHRTVPTRTNWYDSVIQTNSLPSQAQVNQNPYIRIDRGHSTTASLPFTSPNPPNPFAPSPTVSSPSNHLHRLEALQSSLMSAFEAAEYYAHLGESSPVKPANQTAINQQQHHSNVPDEGAVQGGNQGAINRQHHSNMLDSGAVSGGNQSGVQEQQEEGGGRPNSLDVLAYCAQLVESQCRLGSGGVDGERAEVEGGGLLGV